MTSFKIGNRLVGDGIEPMVIAEIGINHGGSLDNAIHISDTAIDAGAEIIKHQTHVIDDEMSQEAREVVPGNADVSIYTIMDKCALNEADELTLMQHIESRGTIFLSTPFSRAAADRLQKFGVKAFKIGSGECNNYPLIEHVAKFKKPIIMSTGMNSLETILPSVKILRKYSIPFALLHCTNVYPTPPELVRLGAMESLKQTFPDAVIGLSDHTTSNHTCFGAVAKGASILERHYTDSMDREGPDIICSMDKDALIDLINGVKIIYSSLGGKKEPVEEEEATIAFAFASVVAIKDIKSGEKLSSTNIWVKRPGGGEFSASDFSSLIGKRAKIDIPSGYQLKKCQIAQTDE